MHGADITRDGISKAIGDGNGNVLGRACGGGLSQPGNDQELRSSGHIDVVGSLQGIVCGVGDAERLRARGLESDLEGVLALVACSKRVVGWQHSLAIGAGEMHGADVVGRHVAKTVSQRDGQALGRACGRGLSEAGEGKELSRSRDRGARSRLEGGCSPCP